jgi:hypothetical protein
LPTPASPTIATTRGSPRVPSSSSPARREAASPAAAAAGVLLLTLPGVAHKLNLIRIEVHKGGQPYFVEPGEEHALAWLARSPAPGAVMAPIYSGNLIPYRTGRRTWVGETSWTPHFDRRREQAAQLFSGRLSRPAAVRLVRSSGVRFLFADCLKRADLEPLLRPELRSVRRFGCASVYQLRSPP